ncbi:hypothetical protein D1614_18750 [Maribellus luteus]|uniref:Uncharacterized protein n=1 Tax=Maribellus luteus TaxID=2305463 RepID=A0A399SV08_9BACT|nr:hypothetical protein D1614_18750 [Maribellus luteus]
MANNNVVVLERSKATMIVNNSQGRNRPSKVIFNVVDLAVFVQLWLWNFQDDIGLGSFLFITLMKCNLT